MESSCPACGAKPSSPHLCATLLVEASWSCSRCRSVGGVLIQTLQYKLQQGSKPLQGVFNICMTMTRIVNMVYFWAAPLYMHSTYFSLSCFDVQYYGHRVGLWFMFIHAFKADFSRFPSIHSLPPLLIRLTDVILGERMVLGCFCCEVWLQASSSFWKNILLLRDLEQVQRCKIPVTCLQLFLCQGFSCVSGYPLFLPSSSFLYLFLRHAQLHQVPRGSNRDFGRSGVVRMPGGGWAQTSHHLDEEGEESQLPALWGTTRELASKLRVWSVWMCQHLLVSHLHCSLPLCVCVSETEWKFYWTHATDVCQQIFCYLLQCTNKKSDAAASSV